MPRLRLALLLACSTPAFATHGYFAHGIGTRAQGAAGAAIAHPEDALAPGSNPAGTGAAGDRIDLGLAWFAPRRSATIQGNAFGADATYDGDERRNFWVPEFGWARRLSPDWAVGVAVYGNGGLNTGYRDNPYARFGATGTAGVDLQQLFIKPALAWQASPSQRLGVGLNVAVQRFKATGIGVFDGFSAAPGHVSDQGRDSSTGAGLSLGWRGELAPGFALGATWSQKVRGRFERYRGLFADGGRFDVPAQYGIGLAWQATPGWGLVADVQRILYSKVPAVGNGAAALFAGTPLGAPGGPGFGWRDATAVKVGGSVAVAPGVTLRAGISHVNQVVPAGETFFNILAPGVVQRHYTLGGSWVTAGGEWNAFVAIAPGKTVRGSASISPGLPPAGLGGGNADVRLKETILGLSYAWKP